MGITNNCDMIEKKWRLPPNSVPKILQEWFILVLVDLGKFSNVVYSVILALNENLCSR